MEGLEHIIEKPGMTQSEHDRDWPLDPAVHSARKLTKFFYELERAGYVDAIIDWDRPCEVGGSACMRYYVTEEGIVVAAKWKAWKEAAGRV